MNILQDILCHHLRCEFGRKRRPGRDPRVADPTAVRARQSPSSRGSSHWPRATIALIARITRLSACDKRPHRADTRLSACDHRPRRADHADGRVRQTRSSCGSCGCPRATNALIVEIMRLSACDKRAHRGDHAAVRGRMIEETDDFTSGMGLKWTALKGAPLA